LGRHLRSIPQRQLAVAKHDDLPSHRCLIPARRTGRTTRRGESRTFSSRDSLGTPYGNSPRIIHVPTSASCRQPPVGHAAASTCNAASSMQIPLGETPRFNMNLGCPVFAAHCHGRAGVFSFIAATLTTGCALQYDDCKIAVAEPPAGGQPPVNYASTRRNTWSSRPAVTRLDTRGDLHGRLTRCAAISLVRDIW